MKSRNNTVAQTNQTLLFCFSSMFLASFSCLLQQGFERTNISPCCRQSQHPNIQASPAYDSCTQNVSTPQLCADDMAETTSWGLIFSWPSRVPCCNVMRLCDGCGPQFPSSCHSVKGNSCSWMEYEMLQTRAFAGWTTLCAFSSCNIVSLRFISVTNQGVSEICCWREGKIQGAFIHGPDKTAFLEEVIFKCNMK